METYDLEIPVGEPYFVGLMSDTHGSGYAMNRGLIALHEAHVVLHAGDYAADLRLAKEKPSVPFFAVRGNSESGLSDGPSEIMLCIGEKRLFLTHSHQYHSKLSLWRLQERAAKVGADIVVYGHTHQPNVMWEDGRLFLNPGSAGFPNQGVEPSVMLLEITPNGDMIPRTITLP